MTGAIQKLEDLAPDNFRRHLPRYQGDATTKKSTTHVETLAKLYLEGKPATISNETITQLCKWLMDEFHQLPRCISAVAGEKSGIS